MLTLTPDLVAFVRRQAKRRVRSEGSYDFEDAAQDVCLAATLSAANPPTEHEKRALLVKILHDTIVGRVRHNVALKRQGSHTSLDAYLHAVSMVEVHDETDETNGTIPEALTVRPAQYAHVLLSELISSGAPLELIQEGTTYEAHGTAPKTGTSLTRCRARKALRSTYAKDYAL